MRLGRNGALHAPVRNLRKDLHALARDTEELLRATADVTNDKVQTVRSRTEKTVREAMDHLHDRGLYRRVYKTARQADTYVRDHSWTVIATVAGVALLVGLLMRRE